MAETNNDGSEVIDVREPLVSQGAEVAPMSQDTNVFSAKKRLGMVGVLFVIAGTAVFFNAEESVAETKIWSSEMSEIKNATALPELRNRKFTFKPQMTWQNGNGTCSSMGMQLCKPSPRICRPPRVGNRNTTKAILRKGRKSLSMEQTLSHFPGLCEGGKRCDDSSRNRIRNTWLPVLSQGQRGWLKMRDCVVSWASPGEAQTVRKNGVVACCTDKQGTKLSAAFAPAIISRAIAGKEMFMGKFQKKNKPWGKKAKDSWDKIADHYRQNDPFLASKQKGTKMKSFHQHASDQLGNSTITEHISNIHGKVSEHIGGLVTSAASLIGKPSGKGPTGPVSGAPRISLPNTMSSLVGRKNATSISGAVGHIMNGVQYLGSRIADKVQGGTPASSGKGIHRGRRPGAHPAAASSTVKPSGKTNP